MPDKNDIPGTEEMDEIDKFLAELPDDPNDAFDYEPEPRPSRPHNKTPLTGALVWVSWILLLISLTVASRALPPRSTAFHQHVYAEWNMQYLAAATWGLLAVFVVCAMGLLVCFIKKLKMTGRTALCFWIAGGASAALAVVFLLLRSS